MRSFYHALTVTAFALLLAACSRAPGADDAEKALQAELKSSHLQDLLAIEDVEKKNGYADGEHRYALEIDYTLRAKQNLSDYMDQIKGDENLSALDRFATIMALSALRIEHGNFKKGDTFHRQRTLTFRETENGWQPMQPENK